MFKIIHKISVTEMFGTSYFKRHGEKAWLAFSDSTFILEMCKSFG